MVILCQWNKFGWASAQDLLARGGKDLGRAFQTGAFPEQLPEIREAMCRGPALCDDRPFPLRYKTPCSMHVSKVVRFDAITPPG